MKKFIVILGTFLTTIGAAEASQCKSDPSKCSPRDLCEIAVINRDGALYWNDSSEFKKHIDVIKQYGVDCGDVKSGCQAFPNQCSIEELCDIATNSSRGSRVWNTDNIDHVSFAVKSNISCRVDEGSSKSTKSDNTPFSKSDFNKLTIIERKQVQFALKTLGYYKSDVDGLWGKRTSQAVNDFSDARNLTGGFPKSVYLALIDEVDVSKMVEVKRVAKNTKSKFSGKQLSTTCRLNDNPTFETTLRAYDYQRKTETLLNDVRQFSVANDVITMGYSKLKPKRGGEWVRHIRVICEMNDNNWSPCGSIDGDVTIFRDGNSYSGVLGIPFQWSTGGNVSVIKLDYTCD